MTPLPCDSCVTWGLIHAVWQQTALLLPFLNCINSEDTRLAALSPHRCWEGNVFKVSYALVASLCVFTACILQLLKAICAYSAQRENVWSFHHKAVPKYRSWHVMSAHCLVCSDLKLQLCLYYWQIGCLCATGKGLLVVRKQGSSFWHDFTSFQCAWRREKLWGGQNSSSTD